MDRSTKSETLNGVKIPFEASTEQLMALVDDEKQRWVAIHAIGCVTQHSIEVFSEWEWLLADQRNGSCGSGCKE